MFFRLSGAALVMLASTAQAATPMVATYATWLRAGPSPWAKELDEVPAGWPVSVLACADRWCQVESDRATGYMPQSMLAEGRNAPTQPRAGAECLRGTHQTPERAIPLRICPAEPRSP